MESQVDEFGLKEIIDRDAVVKNFISSLTADQLDTFISIVPGYERCGVSMLKIEFEQKKIGDIERANKAKQLREKMNQILEELFFTQIILVNPMHGAEKIPLDDWYTALREYFLLLGFSIKIRVKV